MYNANSTWIYKTKPNHHHHYRDIASHGMAIMSEEKVWNLILKFWVTLKIWNFEVKKLDRKFWKNSFPTRRKRRFKASVWTKWLLKVPRKFYLWRKNSSTKTSKCLRIAWSDPMYVARWRNFLMRLRQWNCWWSFRNFTKSNIITCF